MNAHIPPPESGDPHDEPQTLTLLERIRKGRLDPKTLCPGERRLLVSFLMAEGQSTAEIAHLLKTSDRTIERDKKAIREGQAIAKDPRLVEQVAGKLMSEAHLCIQRIRKVERDRNATAQAKIEAEHTVFQIFTELVEKLQSLGYLPTAASRIEADLTCQLGDYRDLEDMEREIIRLRGIRKSLSAQTIEAEQVAADFEANETVTGKEGEGDESTH